jgi:hypothetical protein
MKSYIRIPLLSLLAWMLAGLLLPARAQPTHAFTIKEGKVYIDGRELAKDELPASLNLEGMTAELKFTGDTQPVLELGGVLYKIDAEGLVEVDPEEAEASGMAVFFMPEATFDFNVTADAPFEDVRQQYVVALNSRAEQLKALSYELQTRHEQEAAQIMQQAHLQAEEAARMAGALPRIERESYLREVRKNDRELFEQLMREKKMELETHRLAARIQTTPEGEARDALIEELRTKLTEIFELKQANRRREIAQLERQLDDLRKRMNEREQMRKRIIELRLKDLLGASDPYNW